MTIRALAVPTIHRRLTLLALALVLLAAAAVVPRAIRGTSHEERVDAPARQTTAEQIAILEERVAESPQDVDALTGLASAYLQRARESGDPSFYTLAGKASGRALAVNPDNVEALILAGSLALARHDFNAALLIGERARELAPSVVATYGLITDALVEMGRYDEATVAAQQLADARPNFAAYSRISYIRELHGDIDGAIEAMQRAIGAGTGVPQDEVWARVLLANLYLTKADVANAEQQYERAALRLPDDAASQEGLARVAMLRGDNAGAEMHLAAAVAERPLLQYVVELGDLLSSQGRTAEAEKQYALVGALKQLYAANGVDGDIELSLFNAGRGIDPEATYQTALGAYARRSSIYGADAVAWTALKAGHLDVAEQFMAIATRLGTRDPKLAYHSGMIALAAGDVARGVGDLEEALSRPALLSPLDVSAARSALHAVSSNSSVQ